MENRIFKRITILLLFTSLTCILYSQDGSRSFKEYKVYLEKEFDIQCKRPKGFQELDYVELWKFHPLQRGAGFVFNPILQSKDNECLILYPWIILQFSEFDRYVNNVVRAIGNSMSKNKEEEENNRELTIDEIARKNIIHQLRSAMGHLDKHGEIIQDSTINFNEHINVFSEVEARKKYNADSFYIYEIPMYEVYKGKYSHCTGMVIVKNENTFLQFLWLFTEAGKKKEKEYIEAISKKICFGDTESNDEK